MPDRVFATAGDWAVASDGVQWSPCFRCNDRSKVYWRPVSFVRSTKDVLARCMREKGVIANMAEFFALRAARYLRCVENRSRKPRGPHPRGRADHIPISRQSRMAYGEQPGLPKSCRHRLPSPVY